MKLTDVKIRNSRPADKPFKLYDGKGLYLLVNPGGSRLWRFRYRWQRRDKLLSLGRYPGVGLARARVKAGEYRDLVDGGTDPSVWRRTVELAAGETFKAVAAEWLKSRKGVWSESHAERQESRLERHVYPWIGHRALAGIEAPDLLPVLRRIERSGRVETAHRVRAILSQVFRYGVVTGRAKRDPAADLQGAIRPAPPAHMAAITDPRRVGELLRSIWSYQGTLQVRCALQMIMYTFVRPVELRKAEWSEFDIAAAEWRIPAQRMKRRVEHLVPLSRQVISILEELRPLTGRWRYVFPSLRSAQRPISPNTLVNALRAMGYAKGEVTAHGARSTASTLLNESGFSADAVERQLGHLPADPVRAAYHRGEHLPERRRMMQAWADYLDGLRAGADVVPIRRGMPNRDLTAG